MNSKTFYEAVAGLGALEDSEVFEQLDYDDAQRIWNLYSAEYAAADDYEPDAWDAFRETRSKQTISREYANYVRSGIIRAYVSRYTKDEISAMVKLLSQGMGGVEPTIFLSPGTGVELNALLRAWEDAQAK